MRLEIVNNSSHADAPVPTMRDLIGVQLYHVCCAWPGAHHVVDDLIYERFYLELVDDLPEAPGALGYHDIDSDGRPFSRIGVDPSLQNGSTWLEGPYSVVSVIGHEAIETVGNPLINRWTDIDQSTETADEFCDAVEDTGYRHAGADLTNFLLPAWFNPFGTPPFDYCRLLTAPFSMTAGGYMIVRSGGTEAQQSAGTVQARFGPEMPAWRRNIAHARAALLGASGTSPTAQ